MKCTRSICCLLLPVLLLLPAYGNAQAEKKNTVYAEALGAGGWWSLNYERKLVKIKYFSMGIRGGIGSYRLRDYELKFNPDILFPLALQVVYGKIHQIELALGQTLSNIVKFNAENRQKERSLSLSSHAGIGYRYAGKKGLLLRLTYIPLLEYQHSFRHWAGISIGFSF